MPNQDAIVIVGAGPVGLMMAAELTRFGCPVRLIDRATHPTETSKALVVWSRTLESLERLGCADAFLAAGLAATGASIFAHGTRLAHIDFAHVPSRYRTALMLPQSETERLLGEHLASRGVAVERGVELTRLVANDDHVVLDLRNEGRATETVKAPWVVACDGAHSTVRHALDLAFDGTTLPSFWVLADIHLTGLPTRDEVVLHWHPEGMLAFFPIAPGRYRVIADVPATAGERPSDPTLADVQALLDRRGPGGLRASDPVWMAGFRINERKLRDYRAGRVFLAGDASHVHSPAGGQGMNTGMQDAANLAWKLALVMRGEAGAAPLLDSYSAERSAIGDMVLRNAGRMTALAVLKNPLLQTIRDHLAGLLLGVERVRETMAETMTETSIRYTGGPLVVPGAGHGGPASGESADFAAGLPAVGAGDRPRFTLFADPDPAVAAFAARYPRLIDPVPRPALSAGGLWLVRPDGYVAVATAAGDTATLAAYLDRLAA